MRPVRRLAWLALAAAAVALALAASSHAAAVPWCGTGEPTTDIADAVSAYEWHVIYALPDGAPDRFATFAPRFAGDAEAMTSWWLGQDSTRKPRFDLIDAPGCGSEFGRIDISLVHIPVGVTDYEGITSAVRGAGFESPDKGYLVYFDGSPHVGDEYGLCGQGAVDDITFAYSVVFLQTCGQASSDETRQVVAMHEMTHGMGAVPDEAPHSCNSGHVCDSPSDLMKAALDPGDTLANLMLDVGRDDYYAHGGNWWDVKNSGLLYDLDQSLAPAPAIVNLTATDTAGIIRVDWAASTPAPGVYYRLYDENGALTNGDEESSEILLPGTIGRVYSWTVRTATEAGFLGPPVTIHFKDGYGIVDASGALIRDTVKPAAVGHVRVSASGAKVVLAWPKVADPIGLRGYRVSAPGLRPVVVAAATASFPHARVRGKTVAVAAVDKAGNVGPAATAHVG